MTAGEASIRSAESAFARTLGYPERDYQVVDRVQEAVDQGGSTHLAGGATAVLSVATAIAATVTISFMTLFMLLEGCRWLQRFFELLPVESAVPRWRHVGDLIYRTIGGYVTGNLLISLVDAVSSTIALLIAGVPTRSLSAYWSRS